MGDVGVVGGIFKVVFSMWDSLVGCKQRSWDRQPIQRIIENVVVNSSWYDSKLLYSPISTPITLITAPTKLNSPFIANTVTRFCFIFANLAIVLKLFEKDCRNITHVIIIMVMYSLVMIARFTLFGLKDSAISSRYSMRFTIGTVMKYIERIMLLRLCKL